MLAYARICSHVLGCASIWEHMRAHATRLKLALAKPMIKVPGGIPGDSSHDPNWLWLLAIDRLGSQQIDRAYYDKGWGSSMLWEALWAQFSEPKMFMLYAHCKANSGCKMRKLIELSN